MQPSFAVDDRPAEPPAPTLIQTVAPSEAVSEEADERTSAPQWAPQDGLTPLSAHDFYAEGPLDFIRKLSPTYWWSALRGMRLGERVSQWRETRGPRVWISRKRADVAALQLGKIWTAQGRAERQFDRLPRTAATLPGIRLDTIVAGTPIPFFQADDIRTATLTRAEDPNALPIAGPDERSALVLRFDQFGSTLKTFDVRLDHLGLDGTVDVRPTEVMQPFASDRLRQATFSRGAEQPFIHYTYRLPNDQIGFTSSGLFRLRITEEDGARYLDRPVWISEDVVNLAMRFERVPIPGSTYPGYLPRISFEPPAWLQGNAQDLTVCFMLGVDLESYTCSRGIMFGNPPAWEMSLPYDQYFRPVQTDRWTDLSRLEPSTFIEELRYAGGDRPFVRLQPDYAQFTPARSPLSYTGYLAPDSTAFAGPPDITSEYVDVAFQFEPPNNYRIEGDVLLHVQSFPGAAQYPAIPMEWFEALGRYEAVVTLKQGRHAYRYRTPSGVLLPEEMLNIPRVDVPITAFLFYDDLFAQHARLLGVTSMTLQDWTPE
ncbi:MAG: DUF5103 domain-containing protein [Bacteroidetes bacterium]|nr:DUF5103 domain-containing protein [Bacteroidota bacterium]